MERKMLAKGRPVRGVLLLCIGIIAVAAVTAIAALRAPGSDKPAEGRLVIYSSTDEDQFLALLAAFRAQNPAVRLVYKSLTAREVYDRTRAESDRRQLAADLVISSSMDLQIKLVNDNYAQAYASPHRSRMPSWAVWKDQAYAVTSEPIVIGYNKRLLPASDVPTSHDDLAAMLHAKTAAFRGRIGLYDPAQSPTGYLYISQDLHIDRDNWTLIDGIGRAGPRLFTSTKDMIDRVSSGELLLAYNIIGSYALQRAASDPNFGVIVPDDYVLVGSRVALIPRLAPNPQAARRFLDFMLSAGGQQILSRNNMIPLRSDVARSDAVLNGTNARAILVGPALMANLDQANRARFLAKWNTSIRASGSRPEPAIIPGKGTT